MIEVKKDISNPEEKSSSELKHSNNVGEELYDVLDEKINSEKKEDSIAKYIFNNLEDIDDIDIEIEDEEEDNEEYKDGIINILSEKNNDANYLYEKYYDTITLVLEILLASSAFSETEGILKIDELHKEITGEIEFYGIDEDSEIKILHKILYILKEKGKIKDIDLEKGIIETGIKEKFNYKKSNI